MPPKVRYSRDDIASAAFELVRERGHDALNARTLAERLGCSTQPLLYQFESIDQIRQEAYRLVDDFHTGYIMDGLEQAEDPLMALGLNYVRFGHEEPRLFRFLFQTNGLGAQDVETLLANPDLTAMIGLVADATGMAELDARMVFLSLFVCAHGYASLLANNAIDFDEELVSMALTSAYLGAVAQMGGDGCA